MTWFKVDDKFAFHPKAIAAGNAALGLWVRAGSWCAGNLTDGALPRHMIGTLGAQKRDTKRLVEAGLWVETEDGFQFVDWSDWQPTREKVLADREADKIRVAEWRERNKKGKKEADVTPYVQETYEPRTDAPTRPDPTSNKKREKGSHVGSAEEHIDPDSLRGPKVDISIAKIARIYSAKVNPCDMTKIVGHLTNATRDWTLEQLAEAVTEMAEKRIQFGADSLRIALRTTGPDKNGVEHFRNGDTKDTTGTIRNRSGAVVGGGGRGTGKALWWGE